MERKQTPWDFGRGDGAYRLAPFAVWDSPARVQEDNSVCGFRSQGLSAHKDLKEHGKRKRVQQGTSHIYPSHQEKQEISQKPPVLVRSCIWVFINETGMLMA